MPRLALLALILPLVPPIPVRAQDLKVEFFESKIRPLLADRCFSCHSAGAKKLQAGLYLDREMGLIKGGDSGPTVVPGKPDESLLIRAVRYEQSEMPPDGKLPDSEIALLVRWVEMGAVWPSDGPSEPGTSPAVYDWDHLRSEHWSFRPLVKPRRPAVSNANWPRRDLDAFVLARLEAAELQPAAAATPRTLVRRIFLDLVGFLPTREEVDRFVFAAKRDDQAAVASLVDRLLESPHYGERWGRHWLDVARYSDGFGGFLDNAKYDNAWRYRDWVVAAFNDDLRYDRFVKLQMAGDLTGNPEDAIATGFLALGPMYRSDGGDPDSISQAKGETLDDRVDTMSRGLLGLTVSCARCHDHKFDPIPQQDYYSLAGVFNNSAVHEIPLASPEIVKAYNDQQAPINELDKQIKDLQKKATQEKRSLTADEKKQRDMWQNRLAELREAAPPKYATARSLRDTGTTDMKVAIRGNLRKPGEVAPRRFLKIVAGDERPRFDKGSGREELAAAIADPTNPLTARVIVNRVWQHHFGKAIVRSPSNFGSLGEEPTHPLLLDWLAATFVESDWSIKTLHRRIMTSATYQMSSQSNELNFAGDGDNRLLWRMNPRRMDVEIWRDSLLAVTDELDLTLGGPPFDDLNDTNRRTLYAKVSRNGDVFASDVFLRLFDFPLMRATVAKRPASIVPQQFLFMLNSRFMVDRSRALARRIENECHHDEEKIEQAYALLFGRPPQKDEVQIGLRFLAQSSENIIDTTELPRLVQYAQVLLSSNEFMYVR
jgi:hypothetical protein